MITDTERLDAISEHGFSVVCEAERTAEGWLDIWHCSFAIDQTFTGNSLREAMDKAIIAYRNFNEAQGTLL